MTLPSYRALLVVEGSSDARRMNALLRSMIQRLGVEHDWIPRDDEEIEQLVGFVGVDGLPGWFDLHKVVRLEAEVFGKRIPYTGKVGGGEPRQLHRFLRALKKMAEVGALDAVVWLRDTDGDKQIEEQLRDVTRGQRWRDMPPIVVGCPHQAIEAWVLCGFRPRDDRERAGLAALAKELSFHPVNEPDRLLHQDGGPRSGKRVFRELMGQDQGRESSAIAASLDAPEPVQERIGLRAFVDDLEGRFLRPVVIGAKDRSGPDTRR